MSDLAAKLEFFPSDYDGLKVFGFPQGDNGTTLRALASALGLDRTATLNFPGRKEYIHHSSSGKSPDKFRTLSWAYDKQSDTWYCIANGISEEEIRAAASTFEG